MSIIYKMTELGLQDVGDVVISNHGFVLYEGKTGKLNLAKVVEIHGYHVITQEVFIGGSENACNLIDVLYSVGEGYESD